ncbi:MAG: tRNA (adenosine(37)-N6)-dimethylallyltransferase MiaA [Candidatus Paceibacterota bacterium]
MFKQLSTLPKIIVILGPTASGKSDLAVKIAKQFNGEVISTDSRQVYKGLNIGSGKITKKEMKGIPHHLLDMASPKKTFTVAQYQKLAKKAIKQILSKDKIPIICGGTGFYIDALIYNYHLPEVPPQPKLRKTLEKKSTKELFQQLKKFDPQRAKNIDKNNRRRLIRALEIILTTKLPVPILATTSGSKRIVPYDVLKIGIKKSPEELKKLISKRLEKRLKIGMVQEVERLHNGSALSPEGKPSASYGVNWQRLDDLGLEYRYVSRYLRKLITKKEMIETLNKEIYRYSKRQMTWFRRDKNIYWVKKEKEAEKLVKRFLI